MFSSARNELYRNLVSRSAVYKLRVRTMFQQLPSEDETRKGHLGQADRQTWNGAATNLFCYAEVAFPEVLFINIQAVTKRRNE